ncbi:MAG: HTH domain-containing protein [Thaumarchaeota archaeon]|nr:HTH domain-containing protein [Nitrososphaerota archaeon]MDE1867867.1 HTH domain-containing protein [Nitrososphaerota archaeon]
MLNLLLDESANCILRAATLPKSAYQLSKDCNVSLTTIYRQIKRLNDKKLLHVSGAIDKGGKKHFTFKSKSNVYCKCACSNVDISSFIESTK